jgi:peptidoglycan/xylan/chitin deacetylase (PgdA/CDA1 family)
MSDLKPEKRDIFDEWSLLRMDFLTNLGRLILPPGHWEHGSSQGTVYLTFDDGPSPHTTAKLLELLSEEEVSATFFLIGSHAGRHPELVESIAANGHAIGSHSLSHKIMPLLSLKEIESEIHRANIILRDLLGFTPKLFRPPYGLVDKRAARYLEELAMKIVYWGAVPEDWGNIGAERVAQRVLRRLTDGTIVVLHEQRRIAEQTLAATKQIIRAGKQRGFSFKTLETLC